jgi:hypothetical protein
MESASDARLLGTDAGLTSKPPKDVNHIDRLIGQNVRVTRLAESVGDARIIPVGKQRVFCPHKLH